MKHLKIIVMMFIGLFFVNQSFGQKRVEADSQVIITVVSQNPPTTCGGNNGNITVTATPPPVSFAWSNGMSGANLTGLIANTYTVTATSTASVCTATQTLSLGSVTPPTITTQPQGQILCENGSFTLFIIAQNALTYKWFLNGDSIPGATSTSYTVTSATAADGGSYQCFAYSGACYEASNVANVTVNPSPVVNIPNQTVTYPFTSATFTATGGGTYLWSTGATTASITVNPTATTSYSVTVTGANGCTTVANTTLTVNGGILTLNSVTANPSSICIGESTQLNAVVSNGIQPYSFIWSNGITTSNQMVSPGVTTSYTVTVTDAIGVVKTGSVTVTVNMPPTANAGLDQTIALGNSATIGTPWVFGNSYSWSSYPTGFTSALANPSVTPLMSTSYTVTVTRQGCTATDQVNVFITGGPVLLVYLTSSLGTTITIGQWTQLATLASGGTPPYTYSWTSNPAGFTSALANPWVNPQMSTTYTVVATDALGATATQDITVIVNIPNPPTADIGYGTQDTTICSGDSASIAITLGGVNPWSVIYNDGNSNITIPNITSSPYILWVDPTSATTYLLVSVTDSLNQTTNCGGGATINVNPSPTVNLGPDHTVCSGTSVTLSDQSGNTYPYYLWSNLATTSSITVNPTTTTTPVTNTYVLQVTNSSLCSARDTVVVTVNPNAVVNAGSDQAMCANDSVTLTATGTGLVSYNWMPGSIAGASISVSPTANTQFTVTAHNNYGCPGTDQVNVFVNPLPNADAGADQTICTGSSANLTATGGGTYLWDNNAIAASITVTPSTTTVYSVTVTSPQGCTAIDAVGVTVAPLPTINAGNDTAVCAGHNVLLNPSYTGSNPTFSWTPTTGLSNASIANPTANPTSSQTYTVVITTAAGCFASDQITINVDPMPVITANSVSTCEDVSIQLNASASVNGCSFSWSPTTGLSNPLVANPMATLSSAATYSVAVTSPAGCVNSKPVTVNVTLLPAAAFSAYILPDSSGRVDFTNSSSNATSYLWKFGDGNTSTLDNPTHTYTMNGDFNVWLVATNNCGIDSISHGVIGVVIGIEELPTEARNINIFPNPIQDIVHLKGVENIQYFMVFNNLGQKVYEQKLSRNQASCEFNASQFESGIYYIHFMTIKGNMFPMKIVK